MNADQRVVEKIKAAFPDAIEETNDFRGEQTLTIQKEQLKGICQLLRDDPDLSYKFLSDICADDFLPEFPRFAR